MATTKTKYCPRCDDTLSVIAFGINRQSPDGLHYYCKECAAEKQRVWGKANPERLKRARQAYRQRLVTLNSQRNPYEDDNCTSPQPA